MSPQRSSAHRSDIPSVKCTFSRLASGIYKLNEDILRSIFLLNAEPTNEVEDANILTGPLTTTRYSSQVCGYWRQLILQWPYLWGRLIDLQDLQQKTDSWRNEVLRRSGDSLLCVKVNEGVFTEGSVRFIGLLLKEHWHRLQKIDIAINTDSVALIGEDPWDSLKQPAPYLETFTVSFMDRNATPSNLLSSDLVLFSGQAPSLREFFTRGVAMNFPAPWLSQLHRFSLSSPITDINELLNAMKEMSDVEYVSLRTGLGNIHPKGPSPNLPHITLPRLKELIVANDIGTCLTLVECIAPPPGSILSSLAIDAFQYDLTTEMWEQLLPSISNYFQNCFSSHQARRLSVNVSVLSLYFRCFNHLDDIEEPKPYVSIDIWCPDLLRPTIIPGVLAVFSAHNFSNVTCLQLIGNPSVIDPTDPHVLKFITALTSLTTLRTQTTMLQRLTEIPESTPVAFPTLRTVHLEQQPPSHGAAQSMSFNEVKSFLEWRIDRGHPIHEFRLVDDYWFTKSSEDEKIFGFLEKLPNFKVTLMFWPELREYVCGEGPIAEYGSGWLLKKIVRDRAQWTRERLQLELED
ncbi:hypothetical protein M413DRAFT_445685 [Hebeloma cylindrosporum]|uniref:F-box domain-containing protein n=1 Tax=Hebeloma cylindrosporum TaxID=76867 RepID=A0A0C2XT99_HEBCY|nr:hypothetical protein M413DRAFT_445685 [Hebeloma cylindrosporum h7]